MEQIILPDGSQRDRFITEGGKRRELVLISRPKSEGNPHGCVLGYRDQMTSEDKEWTGARGGDSEAATDETKPSSRLKGSKGKPKQE